MCSIDINKTLRRCKNALKKTGTAESVLTKGVIERMDMFVSECEDSEVADAIRECLYCATKIPVDMTGFAKAIRKYIKVSGCQKTPKWYYMASTSLKKEKLELKLVMVLKVLLLMVKLVELFHIKSLHILKMIIGMLVLIMVLMLFLKKYVLNMVLMLRVLILLSGLMM